MLSAVIYNILHSGILVGNLCTCTCILYICMCMYIVHVGIYVCIYTVTNIFYHLSIPLQRHSAINRTVMPKLKYPFLMKSPFTMMLKCRPCMYM